MLSVGDKLPCPKDADFLALRYSNLCGLNRHRIVLARGRCVVVAIARNCGSTSNVFCRKIDKSGSGIGEPFQLRKSEKKSFWTNEEVTNEGLKFGCLLEYRVVTWYQSFLGRCCELGEEDRKEFIFHRNAGTEPQDVEKILLDLQDDEGVYGRLKEAIDYNNQKFVNKMQLGFMCLLVAYGRLPKKAHECFNLKDVEKIHMGLISLISAHCKLLKKALKCFNPKDVDKMQLGLISLISAHRKFLKKAREYFKPKSVVKKQPFSMYLRHTDFEVVKKALESCNQEDVAKIQLDLKDLIGAHYEHVRKALESFNLEDVDKIPLDLQDDENVQKREAQFHRLQAYSACTRIFFIGIKAGTINNETVTLETVNGEQLEMPLNCRENLVLSTGPVHLQLKRPWIVADDDVGGVAVVKYDEAGKATCEGLILRYKPLVISRDEEPVEMKNAFGEVIPVRGCRKVLFDTGNEVGTGISRELLLKLNLQPDPKKKKKVELIGEESHEFETAKIELIVRGHHLSACGLVDAVAKDTNLLVGMDIIQQLYDRGYTIGN